MSLDSLSRSAARHFVSSPLTLGTMTFGEDWGWGTDAEHSTAPSCRISRSWRQLDRYGEHLYQWSFRRS